MNEDYKQGIQDMLRRVLAKCAKDVSAAEDTQAVFVAMAARFQDGTMPTLTELGELFDKGKGLFDMPDAKVAE